MSGSITRVVVVGGGAAGWITAGVIAAAHNANRKDGLQVILVESPDVATIGVGEGTWPSMRETLRTLGVVESDFVNSCDASFKQGSKFIGWKDASEGDRYYHPFTLPRGYPDLNPVPAWQSNRDRSSFADAVCVQGILCDQGLAPKQMTTPEFDAVTNYAYHLDATKFGHFLQNHCKKKLGVHHVVDHVVQVNSEPDGDILSLQTRQSGTLEGDLFIDCSGLGALLIGRHYKIPFIDKRDVLFNDRALAVQVPYLSPDSEIASATHSTAQSAGWIWDIGLPTRRGVGYVFSSAHSDDDCAERALRTYISRSLPASMVRELEIRTISFRPGYREKFWHRNCVAVGMSSGFLEPLEASALALVELSAKMISQEMPGHRDAMDIVARRFNDRFHYRWQRVIEFLKLHYVLSQRNDSDYWRDNRDQSHWPERLKELLTLWRYQSPGPNDFYQLEEIFPSASYMYILYGMGFETKQRATVTRQEDFSAAIREFEANARIAQKYLSGLPSNRALLKNIREHGMPKV